MKDYTFDLLLKASVTVEAASEEEAERIIKGILDDGADIIIRERADNEEEIEGSAALEGGLDLVLVDGEDPA